MNRKLTPKPVVNALEAFFRRIDYGKYDSPKTLFNGLLQYGTDCYNDGLKNGLMFGGVVYIGLKLYKKIYKRAVKNHNDVTDTLPVL